MVKVAETIEPELDDSISRGHYAKKQLHCKDRLIAWSHRSRFQIGLQLAKKFSAGERVMDYGCGDGTFVAMLASEKLPGIKEIVGAEVDSSIVSDCRARLGKLPALDFKLIEELEAAPNHESFDTIFCMEVLEHVVRVDIVLERLERLLAPEGRLIVSVPVETGLPLLVKQAVRRMAGWRGVGDYSSTTSYTFAEYMRSLLTGARQHIPRVEFGAENGFPYYDHKGFNWMLLRNKLSERFLIEQTISSPVQWLPPQLASQVWFVARKKCLSKKA